MQPNANLSLIYEIEKPIKARRKIFQKDKMFVIFGLVYAA